MAGAARASTTGSAPPLCWCGREGCPSAAQTAAAEPLNLAAGEKQESECFNHCR